MKPLMLGAAIGSCVHVAGLHHFLADARAAGYDTVSLGAAVPLTRLVEEILRHKPDTVALSYRLTAEVAEQLFAELKQRILLMDASPARMIFGGTAPVAAVALQAGIFERVFDGSEAREDITSYLSGAASHESTGEMAHTLIGRVQRSFPYPLLRHHFGRMTVAETVQGAERIARAGVLDVLSLGTDQNAQEHFFHPDEMDPSSNGAGGVPVRSVADLAAVYAATRTGNYPLVRCYSGTRDLLRWAHMSVELLHNAWAAIPLCWYSVLDGRSKVPLREAIAEKQDAMRWYAARDIPVEVNESHQWSLRDAHDAVAVAAAFLAAYNAKQAGVRTYIAQLMLNTPPGTTPVNDLGKMLAKLTLLGGLEDETFTVLREVRPGIAHFTSDPHIAKGQGAAAVALGMMLRPHIVHAVSFSEAHHATTVEELIESCRIAHGAIRNSLDGMPDPYSDERVLQRRDALVRDAGVILDAISALPAPAVQDAWSDPCNIARAIEVGLLDAPHFSGNPSACGMVSTMCIDGAWHPVDPESGEIIPEIERVATVLRRLAPDTAPRPKQSHEKTEVSCAE